MSWFFSRIIHGIEHVAHATGIDKGVHAVVGKNTRLVTKDGHIQPLLFTQQAAEHAAHQTGLDKIIHKFTKGERILNKDGSFNPDGAIKCINNTNAVILEIAEHVKKGFCDALQHLEDTLAKVGELCAKAVEAAKQAVLKALKAMMGAIKKAVEKLIKKMKPLIKVAIDVVRTIDKAGAKIVDALIGDVSKLVLAVTTGDSEGNKAVSIEAMLLSGAQCLGMLGPMLLKNLVDKCVTLNEEKKFHGAIGIGVMGGGGCLGRFSGNAGFAVDAKGLLQGKPTRASAFVGAGCGFEAGAGGSAGVGLFINIDEPKELGGFGLTVTTNLSAGGGVAGTYGLTIGFNKGKLCVYPSSLAVALMVGAEAGVSIEACYTQVLWDGNFEKKHHKSMKKQKHDYTVWSPVDGGADFVM